MKIIELLYNSNLSIDEHDIRNYSINERSKENINKECIIQTNDKTKDEHINNCVYANIEEEQVKETHNAIHLKTKVNENEQPEKLVCSQFNKMNMENNVTILSDRYHKENISINNTNDDICEKIKNIKTKQSLECYDSYYSTHILGIGGKGKNKNTNKDSKLNDNNKCDEIESYKKDDSSSSLNNMNHQNDEGDGDENDGNKDNGETTIDNIKFQIKKELYKKLKIAFNTNMQFNISEQYYIKFMKKKKFRKYVLNTSKFIVILGKYLRLSFSTISMALYYMHKYNKKKLTKKNKPINYIIAGSCIFLAWKLREDFEQCKKSQKLYDIPKGIFKLLNYFYKKKIIRKKIKQIQPDLIYNHQNCYDIKDDDTFDTLIELAKKKNEILTCPNEDDKGVNASQNNAQNIKKRKIETHNEDTKKIDKQSYQEEDEEKKHYMNLYNQLIDLNNIITDSGYVSDINNISDVSDLFNSYLSECNSDNLSEYKFSTEDEKEDDNDLDQSNKNGNNDILKNEHIDKNAYIQKFKKLCKKKKKNINISSSKWVLNNSGQKLQLLQKAIIYYEGEVLKSFNYFIKPKILSFELIPLFITNFVSIMNDYIKPNQVSYLQKLSSLIILDFYKTPLCLIFPPKEILIVCIIKGYISLKLINSELDLDSVSLENFENKIKEYILSVSGDIPIDINRIKMALKEIRHPYH
ncbi:conserved Plasmodium protein, unknown function [Plasmodium chabaudi chabaudi]|uniref:Uncharacterized protein n=1 Tax=Plasmodium chabaudi chabaudi TaxID=31271 RepID=A0A4V0KAD7_PLACU|nr:conserved Plasmodium protein, unknown function [Plasmodium chabaudi chabaudi]VTZ69756.1 conserved Plasmodium protein, unknown function [Plasmodium chabaudi chabaudi]|eukprot:XP_016654290.1 conserved Plasmodium protein, unknown function [Plasmodium chabaudi chabaudi]